MAGNVVKNRKWIEQTYAPSSERNELQKWIDDNPTATTQAQIAAGLELVMETWTDSQLRKITYHTTGDAFDIQPVAGEDGEKIKTSIGKLKDLRKFLEKEGGLSIWHLEFN